MLANLITKLFGSKHERDIKRITPIVYEINEYYEEYQRLSDEELRGKTDEFKGRLAEGETLDDILPEAYAAVKEVCHRLLGKKWTVCGIEITWDMVPYDVQLIGAVVLHEGKITEMATGEGKTLVATMPLYLNALTGRGVHLVTVNDYLALRDREWMGPIYEFLGLTVDCIQNGMESERRRIVYNADITYGTNTEFGFDYLRDNFNTYQAEDLVQRKHYYAIVDEVDSVLIDEARTPLIISGSVMESETDDSFREMKPLVEQIVRKQTLLVNSLLADAEKLIEQEHDYEAGIKLLQAQRGYPKNKRLMKFQQEEGIKKLIEKIENDFLRDKRMSEIDDELYFSIDEKSNVADLSDKGRLALSPKDQDLFVLPDLSEMIQEIETDDSLSIEEKAKRKEETYREYALKSGKVHSISQLLKAYALFEKDVEYVVTDDEVLIVDEFTGRLMPGRRYSDGLHQALEAKENVKIEGETQTLATITIQNYFRLYEKLAGMTGTAETEAGELWQIYKLDVVVIPTNEPVRRIDDNDVIYRTRKDKYNAIIDEIVRLHEKKLPILVGTVSVEVSEVLSRMLKRRGVPHSVLNAKYHRQEAEIVSKAGQPGAVTIATNMAGRGTDIKLGPGVVKCALYAKRCCIYNEDDELPQELAEYELKTIDDCIEDMPCGLHIIGTERHEARRIDRQLRGRSGRQGDPGSSRFFLSLEDDLMRLFGSDRIATIMDKLGAEEGEMIEHRMVTGAIQRAQKRVESHNFDIRKHLLEYDDVMNQQREVIYDRRRHILESDNILDMVEEAIDQSIDSLVDKFTDPETYPEEWNLQGFRVELMDLFLIDFKIESNDLPTLKEDDLKERLKETIKNVYKSQEEAVGAEHIRELERMIFLNIIDDSWKEHLHEMDILKEGVGMRAYGQKDPLTEYKTDGFQMFVDMLQDINREALKMLFRARLEERIQVRAPRQPQRVQLMHQEATGMGFSTYGASPEETPEGGSSQQVVTEKQAPVRVVPKVGRNDPCPCGSGKKYKKCHGKNA